MLIGCIDDDVNATLDHVAKSSDDIGAGCMGDLHLVFKVFWGDEGGGAKGVIVEIGRVFNHFVFSVNNHCLKQTNTIPEVVFVTEHLTCMIITLSTDSIATIVF